MLKIATRLLIFALLLLKAPFIRAQDPHFSGKDDINIWYNPAIKTNKIPVTHVSMRSVKYPNIISYSSKVATIELPIVSRGITDYDNVFFMNLAAGISTDNSSDHFMNASTAMLALSYAMPLNNDNTYLALGLQGNYSFNRVGTAYAYNLPAGFDKYGALGSAMTIDPFGTGFNFGYFTAGAGVSVFHSGMRKQWYFGGSIRHFNHPYTEFSYSARLPSNNGIQAGYTTAISNANDISGYANFTWQAGTNKQNMSEQFMGVRYSHHLNDSTNNALSFGLGVRAGDALIPGAAIDIGVSRVAFYYEINISGMPSGNYHRKALEFSFRLNL